MLDQMPKYAKFMKEIVIKKEKTKDHETVMVTEESSALLPLNITFVGLLHGLFPIVTKEITAQAQRSSEFFYTLHN